MKLSNGDLVRALEWIFDEGMTVTRPGGVGHVLHQEPECDPTIFWEYSGRLLDCEPGVEFELITMPPGMVLARVLDAEGV